ncbi:DUF3027 domain-containing protein [Humibacillus sp. DSM 29435]|uniref:DUF3027 domain-containing protein n=1 Tax=Humibacillus sp. DSM 29435 TaxID=1869167 RepID=UPI0009F689E1|nr:DUF3027 domain-containing protein [Humibacillus sp. DSM 29435]
MTITTTAARPKQDAVLAGAVELARAALQPVAEPGTVGEHLGFEALGERLGMHWFACLSAGYGGWRWGVSVARVPRGKVATVCETNLLPTADAVLAPEWLPYAERLAPGDLGAGDTLPYRADDPYLEAGFEASGEEEVDQMAFFELGLGRPRVLSAEGRDEAASRWYAGEGGPTSDVSVKASARCTTCGYFLPLPGALRATFGVCANEWSPSDGRVISLDHGCGAHSETEVDAPEPVSIGHPIVDEFAVDLEPALNQPKHEPTELPSDELNDEAPPEASEPVGQTSEATDAPPAHDAAEAAVAAEAVGVEEGEVAGSPGEAHAD